MCQIEKDLDCMGESGRICGGNGEYWFALVYRAVKGCTCVRLCGIEVIVHGSATFGRLV